MTMNSTTPNAIAIVRFDAALERYISARDHLNNLAPATTLAQEEAAGVAFSAAEDALLVTKATTVEHLRVKAEVLWADSASTPTVEARLAFLADTRALAGEGPSRVLNAASWLRWFESRGGGWIVREGEIVLLVPDNGDAKCAMHELAATGGREQVFALIRSRQTAQAAA